MKNIRTIDGMAPDGTWVSVTIELTPDHLKNDMAEMTPEERRVIHMAESVVASFVEDITSITDQSLAKPLPPSARDTVIAFADHIIQNSAHQ